jgi:lysozyme
MTDILPNGRPKLTKEQAIGYLSAFNLTEYPVKLLGIRGYYKDTMGKPDTNEVGIYDDAQFIMSGAIFMPFNGNVDPSKNGDKIATLKAHGRINPDGSITVANPEPYLYKIGMHNMKAPYEALRQFGRITVIRGGKEETDTAAAPYYIDIHKGGFGTTSSLGCQTIPPAQWPEYLTNVKQQLKKFNQVIIPYILLES